ncbi:hypothetical protein, partial [Escherichia coli]|uniref:hypothetical protein n=1 Tax=Escherichia coli TaxID=562 RepID=UPI00215ADFB8
EKGERVKTRAEAAPAPTLGPEALESDNPLTEEESVLVAETRAQWEAEQAARKAAEAEAGAAEGEVAEAPAPEMEVFYTFTWAPRPR